MYFGTTERPFSLVIAFMTGVQLGQDLAGVDFVPEGFHRFVTEKFGQTYPDGGRGWMTFVQENTKSEEEALDLFIRLREEFESRKSDAKKA